MTLEEFFERDAIDAIDINDIENSLDLKVLEALERDVEEYNHNSILDDSKQYNVFIAANFKNNDFSFLSLMSQVVLSESDEVLLRAWLNVPEHKYYMREMFRIDLEHFILIVKIYKYDKNNKNMVLYGFALHNTTWDKMTLLTQRQKHINLNI